MLVGNLSTKFEGRIADKVAPLDPLSSVLLSRRHGCSISESLICAYRVVKLYWLRLYTSNPGSTIFEHCAEIGSNRKPEDRIKRTSRRNRLTLIYENQCSAVVEILHSSILQKPREAH